MENKFSKDSQLPLLSSYRYSFEDLSINDVFFSSSIIWRKVNHLLREAIGYSGCPSAWKEHIIGKVYCTDDDALFFKVL